MLYYASSHYVPSIHRRKKFVRIRRVSNSKHPPTHFPHCQRSSKKSSAWLFTDEDDVNIFFSATSHERVWDLLGSTISNRRLAWHTSISAGRLHDSSKLFEMSWRNLPQHGDIQVVITWSCLFVVPTCINDTFTSSHARTASHILPINRPQDGELRYICISMSGKSLHLYTSLSNQWHSSIRFSTRWKGDQLVDRRVSLRLSYHSPLSRSMKQRFVFRELSFWASFDSPFLMCDRR